MATANTRHDHLATHLTRRRALIASGAVLPTMALGTNLTVARQQPATPAPSSSEVDVLTSLQSSRAWINYVPAEPFDFEIGNVPVEEDQIRSELTLLHDTGFRGIVTNAMTYGMEAIPRIARDIGFTHVIVKLWWPDEPTFAIEKRNLAGEIGFIDAIVVGNETINKALHRGDGTDNAVARLRVEVEQLQQAYGIPVTTGLHRDDWMHHPEIAIEIGDFVFPNLQPWWALHRNNPVSTAQWVREVYEQVRSTPGLAADRVVVLQEASYPTNAVESVWAPGATPENQKIFFEELIASGIPFVYGFSFDVWFAQEYSPPGGYGGLWTSDRTPKPVVDILDLGPYR